MRVWNIDEREYDPVHNFGEGSDLIDFLRTFLTALREDTLNDPDGQQVLRVQRLEQSGRCLYGIIETGEYGTESNLWDVRAQEVVYRRRRGQADMMPFYFQADLPEGPDEGILIVQRMGLFGIRKLLYGALRPAFQRQFEDCDLRLQPVVDQAEIEGDVGGKD